MKCVISVLGKDRSGVVAAIATTLADCGANIDDISQTILGEGRMFSMTMMVTLDPAVADFNTVQERLAAEDVYKRQKVLLAALLVHVVLRAPGALAVFRHREAQVEKRVSG